MQEPQSQHEGTSGRPALHQKKRPFSLQKARQLWPLGLGLLFSLFGVLLHNLLYPQPVPLTQTQLNDTISAAIASTTPPAPFSAQVYQIILPSLVYIETRSNNPDDSDGAGVGSGVIVSADGLILTAYHVVAGATSINLRYADGTEAMAEILSAEPENDIAVLAASQPPQVLVPAVLGSSGSLRIGDEAYAVGNPLGLAGSMSAGVISGFERSIPLNEEGDRLEGLIQFDAAVNPGNSGGPLLNRSGQVVGIVTALANPNNQNSFTGIGFAVPISTASSAAGGPPQ